MECAVSGVDSGDLPSISTLRSSHTPMPLRREMTATGSVAERMPPSRMDSTQPQL